MKSPVTSVNAARNRFPKLCPPSSPSPRKRYERDATADVESSESAIMQLRMSPGGSICSSSRRRPELPPSSETVTIAERLSIHIGSSVLPTRVSDQREESRARCRRQCYELLTACFCCLLQVSSSGRVNAQPLKSYLNHSRFRLPIADLTAIDSAQSQIGNLLGGLTEDQSIKVGVITQRV